MHMQDVQKAFEKRTRGIHQVLPIHGAADPQQALDILDIIEKRQKYIAEQLFDHEKDWRFSPGDGGDPAEISDFALRRELAILRQARERLTLQQEEMKQQGKVAFSTHKEYLQRLEEAKRDVKYFPVLFISAPHIEADVSGTFPGIPTPLLYATAVLDRYLRIDEFPSLKVPEVKAVMNPSVYSEGFNQKLTDHITRYKPHVVGISNLSEGHHFALQIARLVKKLSPETIIIMGGSHEDGTNPEVYRRAVQRVRTNTPSNVRGVPRPHRGTYDLSEKQVGRMEQLRTLATEEERTIIDFVAAGDCPYLLMEFMKIVADNIEATADELKKIILEKRDYFSQIEGSGYLFFYDREGQRIAHVQLSGSPLDRNKLPFMFLGHLTQENRFPVFNGKKTAQVMACVGCKYMCSFCYESADQILYEVPKLQQRDPENVIKELDLLKYERLLSSMQVEFIRSHRGNP